MLKAKNIFTEVSNHIWHTTNKVNSAFVDASELVYDYSYTNGCLLPKAAQ
jgi:hypothetical protein